MIPTRHRISPTNLHVARSADVDIAGVAAPANTCTLSIARQSLPLAGIVQQIEARTMMPSLESEKRTGVIWATVAVDNPLKADDDLVPFH